MSQKAWRITSDNGRHTLAALTPQEAGDDVARALARGATEVTVEQFEIHSRDDLEDAFGDSRMLETLRA